MGLKTAGVGHFQIPTAPAAGVSVVSGAANTLTSTAIVLSASVSAMYITGVHVETSAALAATYILVQLCVGGSGAETSIGQYLVPLSTGSTVALGYRQIYPPIPMAAGARLTVKTADSVGSKTYLVTAECILATNVVDDGITVGTVNLCNTLTTYTGNTPQTGDTFAVCKSGGTGDNAAIKAKTDNLPAAPASTTNITSASGVSLAASQHVIVDSGTVTTLSNLPAITAGWLTATGIAASALNGKGDWNIGKTGYALTQTFPTNFSAMSLTAGGLVTLAGVTHTGAVIPTVSAVTGLTASNLDATVSSRSTYAGGAVASVTGAVGSVTGLTASDVGSIKSTLGVAGAGLTALGDTRIANLDAAVSTRSTYAGGAVASVTGSVGSVATTVDADVKKINGVAVTGAGTALSPWGA